MIEKIVVKKSLLHKIIPMFSKMYLDLYYIIDESGNLVLDESANFVINDGSNKVSSGISKIFKNFSMSSLFAKTKTLISKITKEYLIE